MKIQCSFLYSHFYMLMFCILIQGMEINLETDNLLYFFSNPMHPLIQALKKADSDTLQKIIDSGDFNPMIKIYDEDEITIDPISYVTIENYPYTPNTYDCIELLHKAGVPIENPFETSNITLFDTALDYKMFNYGLSKIPTTISGKKILEHKSTTTNRTLFQRQCGCLPSAEIKALYTKYTPCFKTTTENDGTVFHLIVEEYLKKSLFTIFLRDHNNYPCFSETSKLSYANTAFFENLLSIAKNDTFLFKNLYETYCFLESTKQVDPKTPDKSNFSPYQSLMWLLTKMYHVQNGHSAILNAPYSPCFHYHLILQKLIDMKNDIKDKTLLNTFFENGIKFAQLIAPLEDRPLPTIEDLENKTYL